ncbi:hypothetical protein L1049_012016 [Liquidambar formosana]|uniref:Homeobox domain-containing protein n=1 Tax=Liquidambar formosana TaxID=63359 RepID=A0AAP0WXF0_LIQFO
MELGLSLGDASKPFGFMDKTREVAHNKGLGFCMGLSIGSNGREEDKEKREKESGKRVSVDPPVQLDLLPLAPVPRNPPSQQAFPWPSDNGSSEAGSSGQMGFPARGFDVNRLPVAEEADDGAAVSSSPNSAASSFQMDFCIYRSGNKRDSEAAGNDVEAERASSRASDEDENGITRKKLRLSKEQSAFLEESFKEHNTLNPKQKLALAKQLNLRPRQVEVWFQNRRARTKLKQTEVDCEYLKRCCETLTEENRRLHKELQELRALKTSNPFYMQLPATTLTMCPSCERVANTTTTTTTTTAADPTSKSNGFSLTRPRFYPFSHSQPNPHQSAAS